MKAKAEAQLENIARYQERHSIARRRKFPEWSRMPDRQVRREDYWAYLLTASGAPVQIG